MNKYSNENHEQIRTKDEMQVRKRDRADSWTKASHDFCSITENLFLLLSYGFCVLWVHKTETSISQIEEETKREREEETEVVMLMQLLS